MQVFETMKHSIEQAKASLLLRKLLLYPTELPGHVISNTFVLELEQSHYCPSFHRVSRHCPGGVGINTGTRTRHSRLLGAA